MKQYLNDLYIQRLYQWLSRAQVGLLATGVLGLTLGYQRPDIGLMGLGAVASNAYVSKANRRLKYYLADDEALVEDSHQYRKVVNYRKEPVVAITPVKAQGIHIDPSLFPHFMLLGVTGSGKSTLASGLMSGLEGLKVAIAPHWQQGDYKGCHYILAQGRFYGTGQEGSLRLTELLKEDRAISATEALKGLVAEMDYRYKLVDGRYRYEVESLPRLEVILDEYPAWGTIRGVKAMLTRLLLESRKVGIRLWLLSQGAEVSMLGIEGNGSLREQMCFIRGKGFLKGIGLQGVSEDLPGSIDCSLLPKETQEYLKAQSHPWLIGDKPLDTQGLWVTQVTQEVKGLKAPMEDQRYQALRAACLDLGWSEEQIAEMEKRY